MTARVIPIYADGLRFQCTGCGECCRARGRKSYVYTNRTERGRLARHLGLSAAAFTRRYCERTNGFWHLREPASDCVFLDGARCTVYEARPVQCRTYPFWQEHMTPAAWAQVARDCEGIGRGARVARAAIERRIKAEAAAQQRSD